MRKSKAVLNQSLITELQEQLLIDDPDLTQLYERIRTKHEFSVNETRTLINQVVSQLNERIFPPITKMELIHTEGCNLGCTYCFEKNMLGFKKMPKEIALRAIDLLFEYSRDESHLSITHFGGEPTLNFQAIQYTTEYAEALAKKMNKTVEFHMTSNGVLITEEMAKYFSKHNIMVLLSCDGLQQSHDRFRQDKGGRGTFERVMKCINLLKRTQRWVGVKMTVMPENVDNLYKDVVGLFEKGVNHFIIGYATGIKWSKAEMKLYGERLNQLYKWYQEIPRDRLKIDEFENLGSDSFFGCQAGRNSISVTINGEVSPCSKILAMNNKNLLAKLGDVYNGLTHVRNRYELNSCSRLRSACHEQGIANEFQGGCFATNYEENLDLFQPNLQDHTFSLIKRSACSGCSGL
ncbi:radical SAM protein [Bacillus toyonensis]|uniref:Radical SAM core domain-containing protein n=1 Tax=Bacillus toyonensis TaxID=155322 RepID=A0AB73RMU2_9BACI|nr:radical SAM protein [Bacillus toyonensis]PEI83397.1 hypothetical protein CN678_24040 [Bacillus toyonensis]